ncbi:enoyl-[acyl-carrier-protein] reductase FabV [Alteromonas sp. KS69]|uniref:Enoyl-[acyl-carrier-protein] reductase [NADH] n=1 Tax=Alteromonas naphthalenivorans TaxID=715451 RepID=F5Z979_ALTNA|nr:MULTISPECIES: enoyl-ACP reductase FabV [Alteromonas]MBB66828.1 enoyl-[acyl-carrier-protein] reductase FabV [Rickettsiales bacterium]PHS58428.1 MAG: enoyl-[acyl-carrier-protein] reductase FabV [Alteromonas sp.]AEF01647.1 trans-2-enoyl-CoA reductase [Alteromonas naphthalenivorans]MBO7923911.1 trans-2-enoyl-CoA reductase family protein [Alteromonas sp. K632G]RUP80028.1 enoyl-[acyl-carrier-protein] reductase FabV [Alteromonas sp. KS69]
MVIKPKVRGFICTNAHPVGCAKSVEQQIAYIEEKGNLGDGPKNVLVIGSSTGYGLASRITSAFGYGAKTLGVCFEKAPSERKTGTAGWYNTAAFHQQAAKKGLYAETINGDAFSDEIKAQTIDKIKANMGKVDLVIYSLASPRRTDPDTGVVYKSTLKPVGREYTTKTYDTDKDKVHDVTLEAANDDEILNTIKVMGGEDWERWMDHLAEAGVLAEGCKTTAYTYIGKALTWPIYGQATIGKAKEDLDRAAAAIIGKNTELLVEANVSSLKALVTQASSAIPVMPLYISLMQEVMKRDGTHEGCIEQIHGLFSTCLFGDTPTLDEANRYRMDGIETNDVTQAKIQALWDKVTQENFHELSDYAGYHHEFLKLFGFDVEGVDYEQDIDPLVKW